MKNAVMDRMQPANQMSTCENRVKKIPPRIAYDSARGQCMIMLLVALSELRITVTKREAIDHIMSRHWFEIQLPEDNLPYQSTVGHEPRWQCLIAWSRKDLVLRDLMFPHDERDAWGITREGIYRVSDCLARFRDGVWNASRCFLWTPIFKRRMSPQWTPGFQDRKRPREFYRDLAQKQWKEFWASL